MGQLQLTLTILGTLLIIAIIAHGFWSIRRSQQHRQKRKAESVNNPRNTDSQGFDQDGIGSVRVVKKAARKVSDVAKQATQQNKSKHQNEAQAAESKAEPRVEWNDDAADSIDSEQISMSLADDTIAEDEELPSLRVEKDEKPAAQPQQQSLLIDEEPEQQATPNPANQTRSEAQYSGVQDKVAERIEKADLFSTDTQEEAPNPQPDEVVAEPEQVIALHVKGVVQGAVLLQLMTELGLKFGELGIFHRHETTAGTGPVIFSLANMFNPGTFDLDNIENFETEGVVLFLTLPVKYDPQQAFNMMHNAASKLAAEIPQGQVLDGDRNPLTRQSVQHIHQRIREFERQQLINKRSQSKQ